MNEMFSENVPITDTLTDAVTLTPCPNSKHSRWQVHFFFFWMEALFLFWAKLYCHTSKMYEEKLIREVEKRRNQNDPFFKC